MEKKAEETAKAAEEAKLLSINVDGFSVSIRLLTGPHHGRVLEGIEYEDVCKLAPTS